MLSSYEDGAAAYNRADYATARRLWLPLAEGGNADAQTMLGIIYEEGQGVSQDYAAAVTWYRRAADQGHPDAQFYLRPGQGRSDRPGSCRELAKQSS
jgi:uncharacterized protein